MKRITAVLFVLLLACTAGFGCSHTATLSPTGNNVTQTLTQGEQTDAALKAAGSVNVGSGSSGTAGTADGGSSNTGTTGTGTATTDTTGAKSTSTDATTSTATK